MTKDIDWKEQYLDRWLSTIVKDGTKEVYKSGYRLYAKYTDLSSKQLIDEAREDMHRDVLERKDILKVRLLGFYNYVTKDAPRKDGSKGLCSKVALTYIGAIRSFYGTFDIVVSFKRRERLPKAQVVNHRYELTADDVKKLVDNAGTARDRAIILTMFQSGMDVSTLCSLKYHVVEKVLEEKPPVKLRLFRKKAGIEYYSFIGDDAVNALKTYMNYLRARGIHLKPDDPVFIRLIFKDRKMKSIEPNHVQNLLREVAVRSGLVSQEVMDSKHFNPCGSHTLREAFSSIMINHGVPDSIVDFWLGHTLGDMTEAYKRGRFNEVRAMYVKNEQFISVTSRSDEISDIENRLRDEIGKQQTIITSLADSNKALHNQFSSMEQQFKQFEKAVLGIGDLVSNKDFIKAFQEAVQKIADDPTTDSGKANKEKIVEMNASVTQTDYA